MDYLTEQKYLAHFGVKGMKWGVRRYQNADGTLTPAGKKRQTMDAYKNVGASKRLQRSHGYETLKESKLLDKTSKAMERLETNNGTAKYTDKQRAKDYDTAIRGLNKLRAGKVTRSYYDAEQVASNDRKLAKLKNKKQTERTVSKIKELTTDNELMELGVMEAADRYKQYNDATNKLIERMSQDKAVVYTTRYRTLAMTGGDQGYEFAGTDYKVRANTKSRSNSKKYNDQKYKKQYDDTASKYMTIYV